jgi:hypothetical protein
MRSVLRLPIYTSAALGAALVLAGCGGGGGGGGTNPTTSAQSLIGNVFNEGTGLPVPGASVQLTDLNRTTTTDASGNFRFDDISTTFTGGALQVSANGFDPESATVTQNGSALQVPAVGLASLGTPVTMSPTTGGTVSQAVPEAPGLPSPSLTVPAGALPAGSNVDVSLTTVVDSPLDTLVSQFSVSSQAIGDAAVRGPEIQVRIKPSNVVLNSPAQITLPLPFVLPGGTQVPIIQKKANSWREVGVATVDASGKVAVGQISEFQPTGVEAWHAFQRSPRSQSTVSMTEMTLAAIHNNVNNLANQSYCQDKVIKSGQTARISARFDWTFDAPTLPTSPVNEAELVLGNSHHQDRVKNRLYSGLWNIPGGPVTFTMMEDEIQVRRVLDGQVRDVAGSFVTTHGKPSWPRPSNHNQGGVQ